ncbi:PASTA domain-containing protein [Nonomuraea sp. NPDC050663]|uniref:PASTA domain-containing protein n=1 Tax=Nonomuraea sp. NPDC050663 TaxID=3364370 RepID=UPI0037A1C371
MRGFGPLLPLLAVALAACGATEASAPVVTATATVTTSVAPTTTEPKASAVDSQPDEARLPDVVGMNLQEAQDMMQASGFYVLNDKDATGQNRFQVYDRNWIVTEQSPKAGKKVPMDTPVTLWAMKYGE